MESPLVLRDDLRRNNKSGGWGFCVHEIPGYIVVGNEGAIKV